MDTKLCPHCGACIGEDEIICPFCDEGLVLFDDEELEEEDPEDEILLDEEEEE